ncbi:MAG: CRISPR-associated protein Csx16 [Venatoribacter sp.]
MKTWFISRHPGALQWAKENNILFDEHVSHLDSSIVNVGDKVIGSLPVNLAAEICAKGAEYWNLSLFIPAELRGKELSAEQLTQFDAKLEKYDIKFTQAFSAPAPEPITQTVPEQSKPEKTAIEATPSPALQIDTGTWINKVFNQFSWNSSSAQRIYENYLEDAYAIIDQRPNLVTQLKNAAEEGKTTARFLKEIDPLLKRNNFSEAQKIVTDLEAAGCSRRILGALKTKIKDHKSFVNRKVEQKKSAPKFTSSIEPIQLINGQHPQNILALKPSNSWEILIDETGNEFSENIADLEQKDIGKIVALLLPKGCDLKLLNNTHSTDKSPRQVENLVKEILSTQCGVIGASLDGPLKAHSWLAAIDQLIHWILYMLPFNPEQPCKIKIQIENRDAYNSSEQVLALNETIENHLKQLSPARYKNLQLSIHIMSKDSHPYNGYVDAIGNCWGGGQERQAILKRTNWLGHCLLQKGSLSKAEQLYLNIGSGSLSAADWFDLCDYAAFEPEHSLLNSMLQQLGNKAKEDAALWQNYLNEAQYRIQTKNYSSGSLNRALNWLADAKPSQQQLPPLMELQLLSGKLAAENHQGITDVKLAGQVIELANQLTDEAPSDACSAILRIAISATNSFDFDSLQPLLDKWLAYPVAVPGLLNHAKLHSTQGQLYAFKGQYDLALASFDQALATFAKLSDTAQVQRESMQTQVYKAVTLMDARKPEAIEFTQQLLQKNPANKGNKYVETLAKSDSNAQRFEHYLLLRLFAYFRETNDERQIYLAQSEQWQQGEGHPWMLINAYRAWLLSANNRKDEAKALLEQAIEDCIEPGNGAILHWMGKVLHALAISFGLEVTEPEVKLPSHFPTAGLNKLANNQLQPAERLELLVELLPFNFH